MIMRAQVNDEMVRIKDTNFKISWKECTKIILENGFEVGYKEDYAVKGLDGTVDEIILYYHKEKGLILFAESYRNKNFVDKLKLYGELNTATVDFTTEQKYATYYCSTTTENESTTSFYFNTKECLFEKLNKLVDNFEFCEKWTYFPPSLYFFISDETMKKLDFQKIRTERIMASKKEVREIMGLE